NILVFLHADTYLPQNAFNEIEKVMEQNFHAGAFRLAIESKNKILKMIEFFANLRTKITNVPYGDQALFITKELFDNLGGFKNIAIMEDIEFAKRIKRSKHKIFIVESSVSTSPRRWEKRGVILTTLKNLFLRICYYLGVDTGKIYKLYYSN
ncbi:MAG TPA: glycosyltransferase family 2 protein, partial [Elusimicrobiales bacterium]|nr:glycosyltransferase family 2 protein [Elusimicrobiales bacterium]